MSPVTAPCGAREAVDGLPESTPKGWDLDGMRGRILRPQSEHRHQARCDTRGIQFEAAGHAGHEQGLFIPKTIHEAEVRGGRVSAPSPAAWPNANGVEAVTGA